jgi:hypothetical protein
MLRATFRPGQALAKVRQIPKRAREIFQQEMGIRLTESLLMDVRDVMAQTPGDPSSPFAFATEKSARFYFWLITSSVFSAATDGSHWIRSGDVENSWQVEVSYGTFSAKLRVFTTHPAAKYLYGPWQVPGHRITGWNAQIEQARRLVYAQAKRVSVELYVEALKMAVKDLGLER